MYSEDLEVLIDRYVMGRMSTEECREFEERMKEDKNLMDEVELTRMIKESLERRSENEEKIAGWKAARRKRMISRVVGFCAAACVMLGVFISYPYSYWGLQSGSFESYRTATSSLDNIESLWQSGSYEESLTYIDSLIDELNAEELDSEYDILARDYDVYVLSWARIQTLLKMRDYETAYAEVEDFMMLEGEFKNYAEVLYKRLRFRVK